jgi:hypothetical protein
MLYCRLYGGMTEWLKVTVLKTVFAKANVGSNPTPSATLKARLPSAPVPADTG